MGAADMADAIGSRPGGASEVESTRWDERRAAPLETAPSRVIPRGESPQRRVVLLGASNLARAFPTVVDVARQLWGGPLDVLAALGHGRSYGVRSGLFGRTLSGLSECGLWDALRGRPDLPTAALLTDVGNDLLYDLPPETIAGWVADCLDRLRARGACAVLTRLPLANVRRLTPGRFAAIRSILYPRSRLTYAVAQQRVAELDERLVRLAGDRGVPIVELQTAWYGIDPIHIRTRHHGPAFHEILRPWCEEESPADASAVRPRAATALPRFAPGRWLRYQMLSPERYWRWNAERRHPQPARVEQDGTTISLY